MRRPFASAPGPHLSQRHNSQLANCLSLPRLFPAARFQSHNWLQMIRYVEEARGEEILVTLRTNADKTWPYCPLSPLKEEIILIKEEDTYIHTSHIYAHVYALTFRSVFIVGSYVQNCLKFCLEVSRTNQKVALTS